MEPQPLPSIVLPSQTIPDPLDLPRPILDAPRADLPSFTPILVPSKALVVLEGTKSEKEEDEEGQPKPREVKKVEIPFTDYRMPVPEEEILVTAATTAAVSVAATLTATSLFKQCVKIFKPIFMQLVKRIQKKLNGNSNGEAKEPTG